MNRYAARMLDAPRMGWDAWRGLFLLDGTWNGIPVRIRSYYHRPPWVSVTLRTGAGSPILDAYESRPGQFEFRTKQKDRLGLRILAQVAEAEMSKPGPPAREAIPAYFTPQRLAHLGVLLRVLGWKRFHRDDEGVGVTRHGNQPLRWKPDQVRDEMRMALEELQKMAG